MAQISQAWADIRDTRDGEWYLSQARANYRRKSELLQQIAVLEEALASDSVKVRPAVLATELGFGTASSAVSRDAFSHITEHRSITRLLEKQFEELLSVARRGRINLSL